MYFLVFILKDTFRLLRLENYGLLKILAEKSKQRFICQQSQQTKKLEKGVKLVKGNNEVTKETSMVSF